MKALSIRAPWWWFILHAGKDIENRDWSTSYRGPVLVHASKWWRTKDVVADWNPRGRESSHYMSRHPIDRMHHDRGCIVGRVDIVDCVRKSESPWFFGEYGFVLANPVVFKTPIPCKGALGLFTPPDDVLRQLQATEASR